MIHKFTKMRKLRLWLFRPYTFAIFHEIYSCCELNIESGKHINCEYQKKTTKEFSLRIVFVKLCHGYIRYIAVNEWMDEDHLVAKTTLSFSPPLRHSLSYEKITYPFFDDTPVFALPLLSATFWMQHKLALPLSFQNNWCSRWC